MILHKQSTHKFALRFDFPLRHDCKPTAFQVKPTMNESNCNYLR